MVLYHEKILNPSDVKNINKIVESPYGNLQDGHDIISLFKDEDNISIFNTFIKFRDKIIDVKMGFYDWDRFFKETLKLSDEEIDRIKLHMVRIGVDKNYKGWVKESEILFDNVDVEKTGALTKYRLDDKYIFVDNATVPSYKEYTPTLIVKEINRYYVDVDYPKIEKWNKTISEDCECSSVTSLAVIYDNKTLEKFKRTIRDSNDDLFNLTLDKDEIIRIV